MTNRDRFVMFARKKEAPRRIPVDRLASGLPRKRGIEEDVTAGYFRCGERTGEHEAPKPARGEPQLITDILRLVGDLQIDQVSREAYSTYSSTYFHNISRIRYRTFCEPLFTGISARHVLCLEKLQRLKDRRLTRGGGLQSRRRDLTRRVKELILR
jgi:hypothetical protein